MIPCGYPDWYLVFSAIVAVVAIVILILILRIEKRP
jgi:hypothetical protein